MVDKHTKNRTRNSERACARIARVTHENVDAVCACVYEFPIPPLTKKSGQWSLHSSRVVVV